MGKPIISFDQVVKRYDDETILKKVSFEIEQGKFYTLLGPSGCGKTTILRIIAGFTDATEGEMYFEGKRLNDVPANKRQVNTVFQDYALFPHMNVFDNVAFGLKIKKMNKVDIEKKVKDALRMVQLPGYENREISEMSGGQRQRVAIARAIVNEPKVLLLDEPLGALDLKLRKEMQLELKNIQQEVGITFIFVTHDQEEALTMSDKIVVMKDGEIQQIGTPTEIYNEPINEYVAKFIGESNIIDGVMKDDYLVNFDDKDYKCADYGFRKNENVDIVIRPEDIDIVPKNKGLMNGEVKSVLFKGVHYEIIVETASGTSKTVTMHVLGNKDVVNEDAHEKISASNFYMDLEDVKDLTDGIVIGRANAQAWNDDNEDVSIAKVEYDVKEAIGTYPCTFKTNKGTEITINITVVNPNYTEDKNNEEAIQAFDFYKTVDEIKESIALDTDLKQWANAQAWSLEDESPIEIWDVKYDFDDEDIKEGDYQITFATMGREFKVHTTDYREEGAKVGLTFEPEDIHVMSKMGSY